MLALCPVLVFSESKLFGFSQVNKLLINRFALCEEYRLGYYWRGIPDELKNIALMDLFSHLETPKVSF